MSEPSSVVMTTREPPSSSWNIKINSGGDMELLENSQQFYPKEGRSQVTTTSGKLFITQGLQ